MGRFEQSISTRVISNALLNAQTNVVDTVGRGDSAARVTGPFDKGTGCLQLTPDGTNPQVAAAYEVLGDPEKRANFDRFGDAGPQMGGTTAAIYVGVRSEK